jgi:hypothetical protein
MTAFKTTLFMLLVPGLLLVAMPVWLMATDTALFSFGLFRWLPRQLHAGGIAHGRHEVARLPRFKNTRR